MFAGLPGIGVGTLFYVLAAFWMPVPEIGRLMRGTSGAARWRRIGRQWIYAFSILISIAIADRVMLWALGAASPGSFSPAHFLHGELGSRAPQSILAAPITASILLLAAVLLVVELSRWRQRFATRGPRHTTAEEIAALSRGERASASFLEVARDAGNKAVILAICAAPAAMVLLRAA